MARALVPVRPRLLSVRQLEQVEPQLDGSVARQGDALGQLQVERLVAQGFLRELGNPLVVVVQAVFLHIDELVEARKGLGRLEHELRAHDQPPRGIDAAGRHKPVLGQLVREHERRHVGMREVELVVAIGGHEPVHRM